jgi:APA family basic amino acid/polyamine antiporter
MAATPTDFPPRPAARPLGFAGALALVVGNLIGSGIFLLPATLAPFGANGLLGWCVSIAGGTCLAWVFARLGATLPLAGGPYAFARAAFGPAAGFAVAWSYWVMIWVGTGAVAIAAVSNASLVIPGLAAHPAAAGVALVWAVTAVNVRGVALAGRVQLATMALKLVPLVAVVLVGAWLLARGAPLAVGPGVPLAAGPVVATAAITFWSFLGVESATVPADKVRDPRRTVPRATMAGVAIAGALYLLVSAAMIGFAPAAATAASPAPVAGFLAGRLGGDMGMGVGGAVALFASVSAIGAINGFLLMAGELPWAMARGGVFPRWFAAESARGTPARALVVSAALVTVVMLANTAKSAAGLFAFVAAVSVAAGLVAYLASALAAIRLLPRERGTRLGALVAAGFAAWMFWGLGARADAWGIALMLAGLPIYLASRGGAGRS